MRTAAEYYESDAYLYAIDFSHTDLTATVFEPGCKFRCYNRDMPIAPFKLTHARITAMQLLRFIKHGVVDMSEINWDIQDDDIKANKDGFIALAAVMYASKYSDPFTSEAYNASFRLSKRHQNCFQTLIDRIKLNQAQGKRRPIYGESDLGPHHIDDVIHYLESRRLYLHSQRRQQPGLAGYFLHEQPFISRRLDDQLLTVDEYKQCTFENSSMKRIKFEDAITTFDHCKFTHSDFEPACISHERPDAASQLLNMTHCTWQGGSWQSNLKVAQHTNVSNNTFTKVSLTGDFRTATMTSNSFNQCTMNANFTASTFTGSCFSNLTILGELTRSQCNGTRYVDCHLNTEAKGTNFSDAHFENCNLSALSIDSKTNFSNATFNNCVINSHHVLTMLILKYGVSLNSFDWDKTLASRADYQRLHTLYHQAKAVGEGREFITQVMHGQTIASSLAKLQHMGQRRHSWCSLWHHQRNNYFGSLKAIPISKPAASNGTFGFH